MKCFKKFLAAVVSVVMLLASLSAIPALAESYGGSCGANAKWSLDIDTGVLTISGSGDMYDEWFMWGSGTYTPWYSEREYITSVNIKSGITGIGKNLFSYCENIKSISIPDSVKRIGRNAFSHTAYYKNADNWENDVLFIGNHLIEAKNGIRGLYSIPANTKTIAEEAFLGCDNLTSVTIPDSVTSIGYWAFYGCSNLTICGVSGSYAEEYANDYKFNFRKLQ